MCMCKVEDEQFPALHVYTDCALRREALPFLHVARGRASSTETARAGGCCADISSDDRGVLNLFMELPRVGSYLTCLNVQSICLQASGRREENPPARSFRSAPLNTAFCGKSLRQLLLGPVEPAQETAPPAKCCLRLNSAAG
jgi:hypothetical protein